MNSVFDLPQQRKSVYDGNNLLNNLPTDSPSSDIPEFKRLAIPHRYQDLSNHEPTAYGSAENRTHPVMTKPKNGVVVHWAGCCDDERAAAKKCPKTGIAYGAMTAAFINTLRKAKMEEKEKDLSYRDTYLMIIQELERMNVQQKPQVSLSEEFRSTDKFYIC